MRHLIRPLVPAVIAALVWTCSDGGPDPQPTPTPTTVTLSQASVALTFLGATEQLSATVKDQNGNTMSGASVTWSSDNTAVATVSSTGTVTAVSVGTAQVTATAGSATGNASVTVTQQPATADAVDGSGQTATVGQALPTPLTVQINDGGGNPIPDVAVTFAVTRGGGSVSDASATTGAEGMASTVWTLGTEAGEQEVTATASGGTGISGTFTATATADVADSMFVSSGDGQQGPTGAKLTMPIAVEVVDQYGNGVSGQDVAFSVTGGGGTLDNASVMTDGDGIAANGWTLGAAEGPNIAEASVAGLKGSPVVFGATATNLSTTGVSPDPMVEGGMATITGTGFDPTPSNNTVTIGGAAASVMSATATQLGVTVPTFDCRPARMVDVVVTVSGVSAAPLSHEVNPESFVTTAVGEQEFELDPDEFCLQFAGSATGGDEYIIGVGASAEIPASMMPFTFTSVAGIAPTTAPSVAAPPSAARPRRSGNPAGLDQSLLLQRIERVRAEGVIRDWESLNMDPYRNPNVRFAQPAFRTGGTRLAAAVGDTLSLRVPDFSNGDPCNDFVEVGAIVKAVGARGIFAVDTANPGVDSLTDAELVAYSDTFDINIYATDTLYLGSPTDLDGNGGVINVLSIEVNKLAGTAGFVWGGDLFDQTSCAASDEGEIVYLQVPDPGNVSGTGERSKSNVLRQMPSLVAHEFAHAIQLSRRLITLGGGALSRWVGEGQATLIEEVVAHSILGNSPGMQYGAVEAFSGGGLDWYAPAFSQLARFYGWLPPGTDTKVMDAPEVCTIFGSSSVTTPCNDFAFYGASWSLLRYLSDRFGPSYMGGETGLHRDLLAKNPTLSGVANVEALLGVSLDSLFARWAGMLYVDGRIATGPELDMTSWDLRNVMDAWISDNLRLIPPERLFEDFMDSRSVRGGSTAYTLLTSTGSRPAIAIRVRDGSDAVLGTSMKPQLWIVRVK